MDSLENIPSEAIAYQQHCPRKRYLGFEYAGVGLERIKKTIPQALEIAIRAGFRELIQGRSVDKAVYEAEKAISVLCTPGLELKPEEDASFANEEVEALTVAHIHAYARAGLNTLRAAVPPSNMVMPSAGADVVFITPAGKITAAFWRFSAGSQHIDSYVDRHRILKAVTDIEAKVIGEVAEVVIQYVTLGIRRDGRQHSLLIYSREGGRLVPVWRRMSIPDYIAAVDAKHLPQFYPVVRRESDFSLIQMLSPRGRADWLQQIYAQEAKVLTNHFPHVDTPNSEDLVKSMNNSWPQFRHSCRYCEFNEVCDQLIDRPEESGIYRLKGESE